MQTTVRPISKVAALLMLACPWMASSAAVAEEDWSAACAQTVVDYAYYRDRPDADGVAELFAEHGEFIIAADKFVGREAIRERIKAAQGGPVFRHLMSTSKIFALDENRAKGVSYATVYAGPAGTLPVVVSEFAALGEYHDEFVREGAECKFQRREFVSVMQPVTP